MSIHSIEEEQKNNDLIDGDDEMFYIDPVNNTSTPKVRIFYYLFTYFSLIFPKWPSHQKKKKLKLSTKKGQSYTDLEESGRKGD